LLALDEIYKVALKERDPLVSRFAGHSLPSITAMRDGMSHIATIDQLVTAALIEAYRLGASEAKAEADANAKARLGYQLDAAKRELEAAWEVARKALRHDR
jgi:hypothetical protein